MLAGSYSSEFQRKNKQYLKSILPINSFAISMLSGWEGEALFILEGKYISKLFHSTYLWLRGNGIRKEQPFKILASSLMLLEDRKRE